MVALNKFNLPCNYSIKEYVDVYKCTLKTIDFLSVSIYNSSCRLGIMTLSWRIYSFAIIFHFKKITILPVTFQFHLCLSLDSFFSASILFMVVWDYYFFTIIPIIIALKVKKKVKKPEGTVLSLPTPHLSLLFNIFINLSIYLLYFSAAIFPTFFPPSPTLCHLLHPLPHF